MQRAHKHWNFLSRWFSSTAWFRCGDSLTSLRRCVASQVHIRSCLVGGLLLLILTEPVLAHMSVVAPDPSATNAAGSRSQPKTLRVSRVTLPSRRLGRQENRPNGKGHQLRLLLHHRYAANPRGGIQQTQGGWERVRGTIDIRFDR